MYRGKYMGSVMNLVITDVDDFTLEFCHIYRGTLRWHLLTTGWSTFVNNKKLVAGGKKNFLHNSFFSFFLRLHRLLATTMPSRRRTLLKIIILDDIGDHKNRSFCYSNLLDNCNRAYLIY
ncbi:Auxin response factor 17 [Glycine soja]|uniref:Auxin response factor 17 n=1 Tax=Glycine soja TaxID=3848 RepID=A0A445HP04_GLYSO|nr:Auxin response factor 17 [Glycine soja]